MTKLIQMRTEANKVLVDVRGTMGELAISCG
jgi:hypothetical protein